MIDGHYPHVMPHSSNLSFWEKGMTSDIGHTWLIGRFCVCVPTMPVSTPLPEGCAPAFFFAGAIPSAHDAADPAALAGHKRLGNSTELGWEGMSQNLGSAAKPNAALYQQMYSEGQRAAWGSF